ncbi:hypothetical protein FOL47_010532 [Perkinsus chesapeaki]|uniref:Phosphodiesterase n=1 Tax=Perkinsus chesapeaki TaxID=330153 RepID=A0A7J6MPF1_PERCH|nr:hypothetical protein FOL47_010532 [Perkinsus chesapeaki]
MTDSATATRGTSVMSRPSLSPASLPPLSTFLAPGFDIFDYADSNFSNRFDIMQVVAMTIFDDVLDSITDEPPEWKRDLRACLVRYAKAARLGYKNAPFHNPIHAADVTLALYELISEQEPGLPPLKAITAYCAALGHDLRHPGYSNWFAIFNGEGEENDSHPLETMHARETDVLLRETGVVQFIGEENMKLVEYMILGTDMQLHNMWVEKGLEYSKCSISDKLTILLHAADISNPTRTRTAMLKWSAMVLEEFGHERDLFFAAGKVPPKAIPARPDCPKAYLQIQLGFFRQLAVPIYDCFQNSSLTKALHDNVRSRWEVLATYEAELAQPSARATEIRRQPTFLRSEYPSITAADSVAGEYISWLPSRAIYGRALEARRASAPIVAVRLRSYPHYNTSEDDTARGVGGEASSVVVENDKDIRLTVERSSSTERSFTYDFAFDSSDRTDPKYAAQDTVYNNIGRTIVENCLKGFNGCLFAYGQTGSGKSYTMTGCDNAEEEGIIPRINKAIFSADARGKLQQIRVWVSYLEIYNEHLHDLLAASREAAKDLSVMEHPSLGVYVKDVTEVVVRSAEDIERMLEYGLKRRAEGATNMNAHSSRSHAVFRIKLECKHRGGPTVTSRVNLIDLAGSERQVKSGASGMRLREAGAINQSLSALGMVIKQLSDASSRRVETSGSGSSSSSSSSVPSNGVAAWIPFRSSKLTFLLKDSLVGNSKTFMIACISPASTEAEETLSTLRFASSVKKIKTVAKVNVDHKDEQIKSLQNEAALSDEQISALRSQLQYQSVGQRRGTETDALSIELEERQRLVSELKKSYDAQLAASQEIFRLREEALEDMGLSSKEINAAFGVAHDTPYMLNISEDPMLSGCLLYYLKTDEDTTIGSAESSNIVLHGLSIPQSLCIISNRGDQELIVTLAEGALEAGGRLMVLTEDEPPHALKHLDRVVFGRAHMMRIMIPKSVATRSPSMRRRSSLMRSTGVEESEYQLYKADMAEDDSSDAFKELKHYIEELRMKLSSEQLENFLSVLKSACPLVDEANDLSGELRPNRQFKFEVELIWDVFNSEAEDLIVIRLMEYTEEEGTNNDNDEAQSFKAKVLYYWGLAKFMERLQMMRDLYHRVTMGYMNKQAVKSGVYFTTPEGKIQDPWNEPSLADIQAQREFSNRLSQNRNLSRLQAAVQSVMKSQGGGGSQQQQVRRQTSVLSSITGETKIILQGPVSGATTAAQPPPPVSARNKTNPTAVSVSPVKKADPVPTAASADLRESVITKRESVDKEEINRLMEGHFNEVKRMLANALGEMRARKESEISYEELKREKDTLEMENRDLRRKLTDLEEQQRKPQEAPFPPAPAPPRTVDLRALPRPQSAPLSHRAVAIVSFGRFIDSQLGGPHTAFSKFDSHGRKQISITEFEQGLSAFASAYRIASNRDASMAPTTFGCQTPVLFGYIDCLDKGSLTLDDFLYASACGTAHGRGLPLPETPMKSLRYSVVSKT